MLFAVPYIVFKVMKLKRGFKPTFEGLLLNKDS